MIENRVVGGTCVNVGCVPKKIMWQCASFLEEANFMKHYAVENVDKLNLNFKAFKETRDANIKRLNGIYEKNIANSGIDYYTGTASFKDNRTVVTSEGKTLTAEHILIASGSMPRKPDFAGAEHCWTSDDIFTMEELPKSITVLGGGYIAVEMAQIMTGFGVKTTLIARNKLLTLVDQEVIPILLDSMEKYGTKVMMGTPFEEV